MSWAMAADRAVDLVLRNQADLITRSQALGAGLTEDALRHRISARGPWCVVLPGLYAARGGQLTGAQREIAAVLYAGRASIITGYTALRRQGLAVPFSDTVDVLIPATNRRLSRGFVQVHRTTRMPERPWKLDGMQWAPPARAVADAARSERDARDVRALVANAVQRQKCTVQQLADELRDGPRQGSAALRAALEEVADGIRSIAEGDLRKLVKRGGLPDPMYNPSLYAGGVFLAQVDAWWGEAAVAAEVDSREWHLSPDAYRRTQERHALLSAHGILVLPFAPRRIRTEGAAVVAEIRGALEKGKLRPPLPIRAAPAR